MKFRNSIGDSIEITIVGWDPSEDWLYIKLEGSKDGACWTGRDPCLTSREATTLAEWLEALKNDEVSELTFLEPELEFRYIEGKLNIHLRWKLRPPWKPTDVDSDEEYYLSFDPGGTELKKQAKIWREETKRAVNGR